MSKNSNATVLLVGDGSRTKELMKYIIEHPEDIQVELQGVTKPISTQDFVIYDELLNYKKDEVINQ